MSEMTTDVPVQYNLFATKDHTHNYAIYRPSYPSDLVETIFASVLNNNNNNNTIEKGQNRVDGGDLDHGDHGVVKRVVVDVGCGSGQLTVQLGEYVRSLKIINHGTARGGDDSKKNESKNDTHQGETSAQRTRFEIIGLDPAANQIVNANKMLPDQLKHLIRYDTSAAEQMDMLESSSVDIVTVAQALHWFDLDTFFAEVDRILRPNGVLAVITYDLNRFEHEGAQRELLHLYNDVLGKYWSPRRKMVDEQYSGVNFIYEHTLQRHVFPLCKRMTVEHYIQYLNTWSSVQKYREVNGSGGGDDVLQVFKQKLMATLGVSSDQEMIDIVWPMYLITVQKRL